ncbi:PREDICTED: venom dipeptidyl peptidase 4-like, partial [Priapulus caudatus]|uniref:Venom dipeptidyl peptidase 4-like n=1 Tax=Priapulus caudatus TaxID=37621 RepID=A0ABM1F6I7_PRICU
MMKYEVYKQLGGKDVDDQLVATKYIREHYKFIDPEKIAIWGWSYGGFITAKVLSHKLNIGSQVFKCGMAVAPITSWRLY